MTNSPTHIEKQQAEKIFNIGNVDVFNAHINTYVYDSQQLTTDIDEWWERKHRRYLHILVLASTKAQVQASNFAEIADRYGDSPEEWQPFLHEKAIRDLLEEYKQKSAKPLLVVFGNVFDFENGAQMTFFLKKVLPNSLLICDGLAVCDAECSEFANYYNDVSKTRNILLPLCEHIDKAIRKSLIDKFNKRFKVIAHTFYDDFADAYTHIELEIPTKSLLFRRLTNMAHQNLGYSEVNEVNYPKKFADTKAVLSTSSL